MKSEKETTDWESDKTPHEERYWQFVAEEAKNTLKRQNQGVQARQDTMQKLVQYHFLFLGLVFASVSFNQSSNFVIEPWQVFISCIPSFIGILLTIYVNLTLGSYNIGFQHEAYPAIRKNSETYVSALKTLYDQYNRATDENRSLIDRHQNYIYWNIGLLCVGFGILMGSILS